MTAAFAWADAVTAAQLFAVDPVGTGGVVLRSRAGPVRDRWLSVLRASLPSSAIVRHVPLHIADGRLLGGLDLSATLLAGRPVAERGLLSEADGGILMLAMAERISPATTVHVTAAMDAQEAVVERDGLSLKMPARFGIVAFDEGLEDEFAPAALLDRSAFHVDLNDVGFGDTERCLLTRRTLVPCATDCGPLRSIRRISKPSAARLPRLGLPRCGLRFLRSA